MLASISEGHIDLADFLFLVAAIVFVIVAVIRAIPQNRVIDSILMPVGAALVALAFFVLWMPLAVDYFCGGGGATLGLVQAGYEVVGYDNWEPAIWTHGVNGLAAVLHDLSDPEGDDELPRIPELAWFSPPCPPFSAAGAGLGKDDPTDGFPWVLRIIERTQPVAVIIENVPGLGQRHLEYLESITHRLHRLGYKPELRMLDAADFGVPQARQRCFIGARRDGQPVRWPVPTHVGRWVSMTDAVGWRGGVLETGRAWKPGGNRGAGQTIALINPAPTVTTMTTRQWRIDAPPVVIIPDERELAILQGFPTDYKFTGAPRERERQIGNAVPPIVAQALGHVSNPRPHLPQ